MTNAYNISKKFDFFSLCLVQLFGSLWWDGGAGLFYGFKGGGGGGGFEKHCTRASLRSDTVEDLIRLSVEGASPEDV